MLPDLATVQWMEIVFSMQRMAFNNECSLIENHETGVFVQIFNVLSTTATTDDTLQCATLLLSFDSNICLYGIPIEFGRACFHERKTGRKRGSKENLKNIWTAVVFMKEQNGHVVQSMRSRLFVSNSHTHEYPSIRIGSIHNWHTHLHNTGYTQRTNMLFFFFLLFPHSFSHPFFENVCSFIRYPFIHCEFHEGMNGHDMAIAYTSSLQPRIFLFVDILVFGLQQQCVVFTVPQILHLFDRATKRRTKIRLLWFNICIVIP